MYDSLKIFNLGYGATITKVKSQYRSLVRIYHPDKHPLHHGMIGVNDNEAKKFFQLINNTHTYLQSKL